MRARDAAFFGLLAGLALAGPASADDDEKKTPEHKITQSVSYLMVDPIYTTIMETDRPDGMLMIGIGIDVPDAGLRDEVTHAMPVLRDAYVRSLMAFAATSVRTTEQPDVDEIANRLQNVTDRALGKKGARILLAQVALRLTN